MDFNKISQIENRDINSLSIINEFCEIDSIGIDPYFYIKNVNFELSNNNYFQLKLQSNEIGIFEIIFDFGDGFDFNNSIKININKINEPINYFIRINQINKTIKQVRVDPIDKVAKVKLEEMNLINYKDK